MLSRKLDIITSKLQRIMPLEEYRTFKKEMQQYIHLGIRNIDAFPDPDTGDNRIDRLINHILATLSYEDPQVTFKNMGTKVPSRFFPYWEYKAWYQYWLQYWYPYYWWDWNLSLIFED